jgi:hypothetical protein
VTQKQAGNRGSVPIRAAKTFAALQIALGLKQSRGAIHAGIIGGYVVVLSQLLMLHVRDRQARRSRAIRAL